MKICVFGANGYLGTSVYLQLNRSGEDEVVGTYLQEPAMLDNLYQLDVNEPEAFSDFYKQENPDVVVWAVMSGPNEYQLADQGLMHLITHLTPQTKLVYISSDLVFSDGHGPYSEEDSISTLPDDHAYHNYVNGKVKAEYLIDNELTNAVILRAGPIYGENGIGKLDERTDRMAYHLRAGKSVAYRDDLIRTFVHIDDLTNVIDGMVHHDVTGVYHVGSTENLSFYQFMKGQAKQMGYQDRLIEKDSEVEKVDQELPKDTSLATNKINDVMHITFQ
ncbi:sugar nucleotide-binding protein [Lentibacillus sp. N15]|uniref:sugar nucleotide-binding protein n=1 Tax=Lentibacillus songyuanensis TaxID=3136161 RepID=UPI0031BBCD33